MEDRKYNKNYQNGSKKGLEKSNEILKLKGITTRLLNDHSKGNKIHNKLIKTLIDTNSYEKIYDKWSDLLENSSDLDGDEIYDHMKKYMSSDQIKILETVNYCDPSDLTNQYKTLSLISYDANDIKLN
jgi:hypothetical protein